MTSLLRKIKIREASQGRNCQELVFFLGEEQHRGLSKTKRFAVGQEVWCLLRSTALGHFMVDPCQAPAGADLPLDIRSQAASQAALLTSTFAEKDRECGPKRAAKLFVDFYELIVTTITGEFSERTKDDIPTDRKNPASGEN